jgi:hypothetical protein
MTSRRGLTVLPFLYGAFLCAGTVNKRQSTCGHGNIC